MKRIALSTTRILAMISVLTFVIALMPVTMVYASDESQKKGTGWIFVTPTPQVTPNPTEVPVVEETAASESSLDDWYKTSFKSRYYRTQKLTAKQWVATADNRGYLAAIGVFEVRENLENEAEKELFEDIWSDALKLDTVYVNGAGNRISVLYHTDERYAVIECDLSTRMVDYRKSAKGLKYSNFGTKVSQIHFASAMAAVTAALGKK